MEERIYVSIPQAVWIACNNSKRRLKSVVWGFNTASGMDCMQFFERITTEAQMKVFQYRKRYGLHAMI